MDICGRSDTQNAGRSGLPNNWQRIASSSCTQGTPAGLPCGMPGIGEPIDGAMQQAPQPSRQFTSVGGMQGNRARLQRCENRRAVDAFAMPRLEGQGGLFDQHAESVDDMNAAGGTRP